MMKKASGSPFHTDFHYICHFSIMVLGAMVYTNRLNLKMNHLWLDLFLLIVSFIMYFAILVIGKGRVDGRYYVQVLALVPLHSFVYYAYKVVSYKWVDRCFRIRGIGWLFSAIAGLTLEIYVVQFAIITDRYNSLFPLNIFIVFALICIAAYGLKVVTSVFLSVMSKDAFDGKAILKI